MYPLQLQKAAVITPEELLHWSAASEDEELSDALAGYAHDLASILNLPAVKEVD